MMTVQRWFAVVGASSRGESLTAFDERCIPFGGVGPRSNTPEIRGRRALAGGRLIRRVPRQSSTTGYSAQVVRGERRRHQERATGNRKTSRQLA
jgi:hypothetical protein